MFGFLKKKVTMSNVAEVLAQMALMPLERPSDQDVAFNRQALNVGVGQDRFTLEVIALQVYAMGAAINRERLETRITTEQAKQLIEKLIQAVYRRLETTSKLIGLSADAAIDLIMERGDRYVEPAWSDESPDAVRKLFAQFCGVPNSSVTSA
jgi:hypothetical protein